MFRRLSAAVTAVCLVSTIALAHSQAPASVAGAWQGEFVFEGKAKTEPFRLVLKQEGNVVTGTAGPDADRQAPIDNVKLSQTKDGPALTFELAMGSLQIAFDVKLAGGILKGTADGGRNGAKEHATLELKPVK